MIGRKGQLGEQIMLFMFIFLMIIIGAGIVFGTYMFVGDEIDFRGAEAALLNRQIRECISEGNLEGLASINEDTAKMDFIVKNCNLNFNTIDSYNLIKICINEKEPSDCINENNPIFSMGRDFTPCGLTEGTKFLGCSINNVGSRGTVYTVIATSKQKIRRVAK